jgi:hypothetical protein
MKEAIILVSAFGTQCQNFYLDNFLVPGLLSQLEDVDIKLDPEDVKIPGQTGKRFLCQLENGDKTIDVYEVYWQDLINRLSAQDIKSKFIRGMGMIFYWFGCSLKIMKTSPVFFIQISIILILVLLWYYGVVILILAGLSEQVSLNSVSFLQNTLGQISDFATTGNGWQIWLFISAMLALLPKSINLVIDFTDCLTNYLRDESIQGKPPIRALFRNRLKQVVDNVSSEESYDRVTILGHSMGSLIATDFLADYQDRQGKQLRFITWGSALETTSSVADWMKLELQKCLENPYIYQWEDFYSNQDWFCSKVPVLNEQTASKIVSKKVSFRVSLIKQISGASHMEYFFDSKVLRHLVMG